MSVTRRWAIGLTLSTLLVTAACGSDDPSPSESEDATVLKIGAIFPLTGPNAVLGTETFQGAEIARQMFNDQQADNGIQVEFITADAPDPNAATSEATRLATREKVDIIVGTQSSALSLPASAVAEREGVIYWETVATSDEITARGFKNIFRYNATGTTIGTMQVDAVADFLAPELGVSVDDLRVAIVSEDSAYGATISAAASKHARERNLNVVAEENYNAASTRDFSSLILKLNQQEVDVMIGALLVDDTIQFFRQAEQIGFAPKAVLVTGGVSNPAFYEAFGDKTTGIFVGDTPASASLPDSALSDDALSVREEYRRRYTEAYGADQLSTNSDLGFSGTWVLLNNVLAKTKSTDPDAVRAAALELDLPLGSTLLGYGISYAPADAPNGGQNTRALTTVTQWQDGELVTVYPEQFAEAEPVNLPLAPWGE